MNTTEIENILRHAPQPKPPGILKQQLKAQALRVPRTACPTPSETQPRSTWLARWWPALAPAAVSLACAAVFSLQQSEIRSLTTAAEKGGHKATAAKANANPADHDAAAEAGSVAARDEIARLRDTAASLQSEVGRLERMRNENEKLKAQLAAPPAEAFTAEETQALEQARSRALCIQCVNNLKQLGLAVRIWATDNGDTNPPNLSSLNKELASSFKTLVCPADTGRQAAQDWASFTPANCSYEYLAPSSPDTEPNRILFRCPIHGNVCLCDGSVQMELAKKHPEQIVQQDGKLYAGQPANRNAPGSDSPNQGQ